MADQKTITITNTESGNNQYLTINGELKVKARKNDTINCDTIIEWISMGFFAESFELKLTVTEKSQHISCWLCVTHCYSDSEIDCHDLAIWFQFGHKSKKKGIDLNFKKVVAET